MLHALNVSNAGLRHVRLLSFPPNQGFRVGFRLGERETRICIRRLLSFLVCLSCVFRVALMVPLCVIPVLPLCVIPVLQRHLVHIHTAVDSMPQSAHVCVVRVPLMMLLCVFVCL